MKRVILALLSVILVQSATGTNITVDATKEYNVSKNGNDVEQLQRLALNVGSEFNINRVTDAYLKKLGIRTLRLINVSISGRFDERGNFVDIKPSKRLKRDLALCQRIGANPHIIISGLPEQLLKSVPLKVTRHRALGIDLVQKRQKIGPTNYRLLENWFLAYYEYIKVKRGFKNAVFEIFNEPDLGSLIYPTNDIPAKGTDKAYEAMFKIYQAASAAAIMFEKKYPGMKLIIGGPAITLAFTYRQGDKGWAKRFVVDCAKEKLKLDFLGIHHYASVAPFSGKSRSGLTAYPSFPEMIASVQSVIDRNKPGLPIWLTEYGAHHNVVGKVGDINGSHDGAAFSLECLNSMLENGIGFAIYLVTTDQQRYDRKTKQPYNVYSWCSFLVSPDFFGYPYPKAPYNAYRMVAELAGKRVLATSTGGNTRAFAALAPSGAVKVILWNFATYVPELKPLVEEGKNEPVKLTLNNVKLTSDTMASLTMVDAKHGDILSADRAGRPVNLAAATPEVRKMPVNLKNNALKYNISMAPGSVAILEIGPDPNITSLQTKYSPQAEVLLKVMRDNGKQPGKVLEAGNRILAIADADPAQKIDALSMMTETAARLRRYDDAKRYALQAEKMCRNTDQLVPFAVARQLGDAAMKDRKFYSAVNLFKQSLKAPDCDWRKRFGTELRIIQCLNAEKKYREVIEFCDAIIARDEEPRLVVLKGDFRLRKLDALRNLGEIKQMFAVYRELMDSNAQSNAKLGGVIVIVTYYRSQKEPGKALAEGKVGLALKNTHPGLLNKLKVILKLIKNEQAK